MTAEQHAMLRAHLFPGDGKEAVALAICGRARGPSADWPRSLGTGPRVLIVHRIELIPHDQCNVRTPNRVTWPTAALVPVLPEAAKRGFSILKIHSHPTDYRRFSDLDDAADLDLFPSVAAWLDDNREHCSAVMIPDGRVFARFVSEDGGFSPVELVTVVGEDLWFWYVTELDAPWSPRGIVVGGECASADTHNGVPAFATRTAQAFGAGTVALLRRLSIAVIGVSGTGSLMVEMLARLGVGELVLVDDDRVEDKNLGRIVNATQTDAEQKAYKVDVLARAVDRMGFGSRVLPIAISLWHADVVRRVAQCDIVVGCMDTYDGRDLLNRLATYYGLPYFDVGVRLEADGRGGVDQICGTVHYLRPGGSSLGSRGIITPNDVRAAALKRTDPDAYREQVRAKYLRGVVEDRPAVISVNALFSSLAVNEVLARLHGYRDDGNTEYASYGMSLTQARLYNDVDGAPCGALAGKVGRGDTKPLLGSPELSVRPPAPSV